jgi:Concanavalin A-like lectin/glucanases superfamily/Lamin Tail Domain/CotH kinase protein
MPRLPLFIAAALAAAAQLRAGTSAYRNVILADNPVAYWELDEAAGVATAADSAGTPQTGSYQNVTLGQTSAYANLATCGQFNGSTSRVQVAADNIFNLGTADFSVEAWAKTPVATRGDVFNYKNATDFGIFLNNSGSGSIGGYLNGFLPSHVATINAWYHIVITRSAGTARLYVNGVERGVAAAASSFSANAPVFIGANHTGAPGYTVTIPFNGWIDEVAVYGTALSAARVLDHYNAAQAAPSGSPTITNSPATNITSTSARLGGTITDPGSSTPTVTVYYGDNDGGSSLSGWDANVGAGSHTGAFFVDVNGLAANTQHWFRCYAQNASGGNWASPSLTFTTPAGPPAVINVAATNILATSATVGAQVTSTGGSTTAVTLFYGTTDGGTTATSWEASVPLGAQSGSVSTNLTNLIPSTTYYFRARAANSGSTVWAPATASFSTPTPSPAAIANLPASNVTIFWATLRGQVTSTGNSPPDVTIYWGTADGGTSSAAWENAASLGVQSGPFSSLVNGLAPSTTYYYRARAVNVAGTTWAAATQSFTTPATSALEVVINEIHCDHEDKTLRVEFIELHNPGAQPVDLTGWAFTKGVDFTFPSGAAIPAGGYAVVAENPAVLQTTYGYAGAYGPWSGLLQADGETITLRNPAGEVADEVDFGMGYPWPTVGEAPNYSMELINPALDNNLGGHWRSKAGAASGTDPDFVLVPAASTAWRFRRGCFAAPAADWTTLAHTEDSLWENGTTTLDGATGYYKGIGYADNDDATSLAAPFPADPPGIIAMLNGYRGVYLRHLFNVNADDIRANLKLRVYVDDGAVVWINGNEVPQRFFVSSGTVGHNGTGVTVNGHEAAPNTWAELSISNMAAWINAGPNVIAILAMNDALGSSDFSINAELLRVAGPTGGSPTPGAVNSVFAANAAPATRQVDHMPATPVPGQTAVFPGQDVSITVKATDPDGVQSISLLYQTVDPGNYIRKEAAAYELAANWTALPMTDNGGAADLIAGDSIYTGVIPAAVQTHRRLVRYRIVAADTAGNSVRVPYNDDPAPNFAYFVYGTMPDYTGAINPTSAPSYTGAVIPSHTPAMVTYPASMLQALPTYHLITTRQNRVDAQYLPGTTLGSGYRGDENINATDEQSYPWRGTLVYDGKVYDHIRFRARGGVWRYSMGKNMWKFDMVRGHDFDSRDNFGEVRDEKWKKVNFSACIQQGDFLNRGEQGLYEAAGFRLFQLSGMPANHTNWVHFRIIENADEMGPTSTQYDDDFQGLYLAIEQEDGQFLKEHGLPDGNLYKMEGGTGELNNQGPTQPKNKSDLNAFMAYSTQESWWRQNVVLPEYYNYRAIVDCIHHYDIGDGKNYFYYHYPIDPLDPNSNKWQQAVWDLDLVWADNMYRADSGIAGLAPSGNTTEPFFSRVYNIMPLRTEMRNRHREILDLLWNLEQTGMVIDELASFIYQPGQPSFVAADRAMWDYNPIMVSAQINASKAGRGRFYQSAVDDPSTTGTNESLTFPGMLQKMRNYVTTRRNVITNQILTDESVVPSTPVVTRAGGATTFPTNDLTFTTTAYTSPSSRPFSKMKWRIAEITNPAAPDYNRWDHSVERQYEADPKNTWESPEITTFSNTFTFPAAAAHADRTYRVRVKYADAGDAANGNTPRWSHWSAPVTFVATVPDVSVYLSSLVVSEVMYHPRDPSGPELDAATDKDEFEYVVVMNAGALALDLTNIRFTKGIDFDFAGSSVTSLAPGERAVVVKNAAAFNARYAGRIGSIRVAGAWQPGDNLANSGEQLKLSFGAGTPVRDFTWDDDAPWPAGADGDGYSLVLVAPWTVPDHSLAQNWRLSTGIDGCPGQYDGLRLADWLAAHGVTGALADPDKDGLSNLLECALFGNPIAASQSPLPAAAVEEFPSPAGPEYFLTLTFRSRRGADDLILMPERSSDLSAWDAAPAGMAFVSAHPDADGGTTWKWRSTAAWNKAGREFLRLRVSHR